MNRIHVLLPILLLLTLGCEGNRPTGNRGSVKTRSLEELGSAKQGGNTEKELIEKNNVADIAVTHADLDSQISRSKDQSTWHYGERTPGELAGIWTSVDGSGDRLVFGADGSVSEDLAGNMTQGVYAISDKGRILSFSKWNETGLRSHFWLDGEKIRGPRGPIPNAYWERVETK